MENFSWIKKGEDSKANQQIVNNLDFRRDNDNDIEQDEKDAETRRIIGRPEDEEASIRVLKLFTEADKFKQRQEKTLTELSNRLYDINSILGNIKDLESSMKTLKEDKKNLDKQSLEKSIAHNVSSYEEDENFLSVAQQLDQDIAFYEKKLAEINEHSDKKIFLESQKKGIEDMLDRLENLLNPKNPSLN